MRFLYKKYVKIKIKSGDLFQENKIKESYHKKKKARVSKENHIFI